MSSEAGVSPSSFSDAASSSGSSSGSCSGGDESTTRRRQHRDEDSSPNDESARNRIEAAYKTPGLRVQACEVWSSLLDKTVRRSGTRWTSDLREYADADEDDVVDAHFLVEPQDVRDPAFADAAFAETAKRYLERHSEQSDDAATHDFNQATQRWEGAAVDLTGFDHDGADETSPPKAKSGGSTKTHELSSSLLRRFERARQRHDRDLERFLGGGDGRWFASDGGGLQDLDALDDDDNLATWLQRRHEEKQEDDSSSHR